MTPPPLEDRLNRLADGLVAPPTPEARQAVGARTRVLRRRRRAWQAAGVGALVVAAVAGSIAVTRDTAPQAQTSFSNPHAALPALTLDVDGWNVVAAEDTVAKALPAATTGKVQLFHVPGDIEGPSIVLRHWAASDPVLPIPGTDEEAVEVADAQGYLRQTGTDDITLRWAPPLGDNAAEIEAHGLSPDEVEAFAEGLESRDGAIQYPPVAADRFGFNATYLPAGLEEEGVAPDEPPPARRLVAQKAGATAELTVEATGDSAYWATVSELEQSGPAEPLTVMGHPAYAAQDPDDLRWTVVWQPSPGTTGKLTLSGVDQAGLAAILSGVREIDEEEWDALVAAHEGS